MCAKCRAHLTIIGLVILIWLRVEFMNLLIMQFSLSSYSFIPSRFKISPQHTALKCHPSLNSLTEFHTYRKLLSIL
jgi:hypothetical protein